MSGLVEQLRIETDTRDQLVNAIKILMVWNHQVSTFKTGKDVNGKPFLSFDWHENGGGKPLIAPLTEATAVADQIYAWLKTAEYGEQPDTDGSNSRGWLVENNPPRMTEDKYESRYGPYHVLTVYPSWVTYDK